MFLSQIFLFDHKYLFAVLFTFNLLDLKYKINKEKHNRIFMTLIYLYTYCMFVFATTTSKNVQKRHGNDTIDNSTVAHTSMEDNGNERRNPSYASNNMGSLLSREHISDDMEAIEIDDDRPPLGFYDNLVTQQQETVNRITPRRSQRLNCMRAKKINVSNSVQTPNHNNAKRARFGLRKRELKNAIVKRKLLKQFNKAF